jgi:hypothetical protein
MKNMTREIIGAMPAAVETPIVMPILAMNVPFAAMMMQSQAQHRTVFFHYYGPNKVLPSTKFGLANSILPQTLHPPTSSGAVSDWKAKA